MQTGLSWHRNWMQRCRRLLWRRHGGPSKSQFIVESVVRKYWATSVPQTQLCKGKCCRINGEYCSSNNDCCEDCNSSTKASYSPFTAENLRWNVYFSCTDSFVYISNRNVFPSAGILDLHAILPSQHPAVRYKNYYPPKLRSMESINTA